MKWAYRLVMDTGKSVTIVAKSRSKAIEAYRMETGVSRDWMAKHYKVINCGRFDRGSGTVAKNETVQRVWEV